MEAWALHGLGRVAYFDQDPASARAFGLESLTVAEAVGDRSLIAWALHLLGLAAYIEADYPTARRYYQDSLAIRRELGYQEGIGVLLTLLGLVALREGDLGQAHALYSEALAIMHLLVGPWNMAMILAAFSSIAAAQRQSVRAVRLGAAASALGESYQTPLIPLFETLLAEGLDLASQALGQPAYGQAWAEGMAMSLDDAIAEALSVRVLAPSAPPVHGPQPVEHRAFGGLTAAELQVLRLLAAGRTTREIAGELVVAVSTIDRHITHIYEKLSVRNRTEATALALRLGLV
jgi:non-specific serine/threonine protein kinase